MFFRLSMPPSGWLTPPAQNAFHPVEAPPPDEGANATVLLDMHINDFIDEP